LYVVLARTAHILVASSTYAWGGRTSGVIHLAPLQLIRVFINGALNSGLAFHLKKALKTVNLWTTHDGCSLKGPSRRGNFEPAILCLNLAIFKCSNAVYSSNVRYNLDLIFSSDAGDHLQRGQTWCVTTGELVFGHPGKTQLNCVSKRRLSLLEVNQFFQVTQNSVQLRPDCHVLLANLHAGLKTYTTTKNAPEKDLQ